MNIKRENNQLHLRWTDLTASYTSTSGLLSEKSNQTVLHACCGEVRSGSITAVLGPSGAGKSTLFNCITGQIPSGLSVTGKCFIRAPRHSQDQLKRSRIAYVPQAAEFFTLFTVRETLLFASRLNNVNWTREEHDTGITSFMVSFDMQDKLDWPIRKLSGGQQKRVAIACELVSSPAAIVLDEPTSGLDADNAEKLIRHLKSLLNCANGDLKPAILLSIHSPSLETFHSFDQVYILSTGGFNIFQGAPASATQYFQSQGYPNLRGNPAEWCLEVATGKYGTDKFASLVDKSTADTSLNFVTSTTDIETQSMNRPQSCTRLQIWFLTVRSLDYYFTKLPQAILRALSHIFILFMFEIVFLRKPLASDPLCWLSSNDAGGETTLYSLKISLDFRERFHATRVGSYFFIALILTVAFIGSVTSIIIGWYHGGIHERELRNTWYSRNSYFVSKLISESTIRTFCLACCGLTIYQISDVTIDAWRVLLITTSMYLLCGIWENLSSAVTLSLRKQVALIPIFGVLSLFEFFDVALLDAFVFQDNSRVFARLIKRLSPMNNAFVVSMLALFGFERCPSNITGELRSLTAAKNDSPKKLVSRAWQSLNLTRDQFIDALDIYESDESTVSGLFDSLTSWVLPSNQLVQKQPSYILSSFSYDESHLLPHSLILLTWLCVSCLALFFVIKRTSL